MRAYLKVLMVILVASLPITDTKGQQDIVKKARLEKSLRKQIKAGEFDAVRNLRGPESLPLLLNLLMLEETHQFDEQGPAVRAILIANIAAIPGHAKYLGDEIEQLSNQPLTGNGRDNSFTLLTAVASKEAVAELGRFLFDDRSPDKELSEKYPAADGGGYFLFPNSNMSANAIGILLGDKSPVKTRRPGYYGGPEIKQIQEWWKSREGEAFRGVAVATPPPNIPLAPPPPRGADVPSVSVRQNTPKLPWLVGIAALIVIVALVLKRRA